MKELDQHSNWEPYSEALKDPFRLRIHEEVEEFLRDLTLEFPFQEIFECLRRYEFKHRHGAKVIPFPRKSSAKNMGKNLETTIDDFLKNLESEFGQKHSKSIQESFKYFTSTTYE